jgi:hypothetical protein
LRFGAVSSAIPEPSVEILERLRQPDLGRVQFAHRNRQPVFGEVLGLDAARPGKKFHRAQGGFVAPVGQHVDVRVRHPLSVDLSGCLRERAIAEPARIHQSPQRLAERLLTSLSGVHHQELCQLST